MVMCAVTPSGSPLATAYETFLTASVLDGPVLLQRETNNGNSPYFSLTIRE